MSIYTKSLLLFALNWADAQLTIIWVRGGWATEGNGLMARLLETGNGPFLITKLTVGALVAYTLYHWGHLTLAQRGMKLTLGLYIALMFVHAATGMSALGWPAPEKMAVYIASPLNGLLTLFF